MAASQDTGFRVPNWERVGGLTFRFTGSSCEQVRLSATRRDALSSVDGRCPMWCIELKNPSVEDSEGGVVKEIDRERKRGAARARMIEWMREHNRCPLTEV